MATTPSLLAGHRQKCSSILAHVQLTYHGSVAVPTIGLVMWENTAASRNTTMSHDQLPEQHLGPSNNASTNDRHETFRRVHVHKRNIAVFYSSVFNFIKSLVARSLDNARSLTIALPQSVPLRHPC